LATRNNGAMLAFEPEPHGGRNFFAVKLHSKETGNPLAIGARVSVICKDGHSQTSEVYAGGGYESQSSATLFFGYTSGGPPDRIEVRWPSGKATTSAWESGKGEVRIFEE
jgi:hypothetical protein